MNYSVTTIGGSVEILAADEFKAIPIKVAHPSGTPGIVKAGTPLTSAGASTTGSGAVGILLYDVDTSKNPNGAAVVEGIIDAAKAQAWCGVEYNTSDLKAALPAVYLRDNIKAISSDAHLKSLAFGSNALTLSPSFASDVYSYETTTTTSTNTITVAVEATGATAVIKNGDDTVTSGSAATWAGTSNTVTITVTAPDGETTRVYTVAVAKT